MNEQDYIDATNLAKARIAQDITGSILTTTNAEHKNRMAALSALGKIIERLEKKVSK